MALHVVLDPDATPGVSKVMIFPMGFGNSNPINQLKNDHPKILARLCVNFKKTEHLFFWTKQVARKCKMSKCSSSGQKRWCSSPFLSERSFLFFFHKFKWASMMQMPSIYFRSTPTWRNVVHSPVPWANQYKKWSLNWISCESQWSSVGTEASQNPYQYVYTSICIYILDTVVVNWFSYTRVSIYVLLSYGIFIHFIIWG